MWTVDDVIMSVTAKDSIGWLKEKSPEEEEAIYVKVAVKPEVSYNRFRAMLQAMVVGLNQDHFTALK